MASLMPITQYNESIWDKLNTNTNKRTVVYVNIVPIRDRMIVDLSEPTKTDNLISKLVINKKFITYIDKTDAKILEDISKFEDIVKKYRKN